MAGEGVVALFERRCADYAVAVRRVTREGIGSAIGDALARRGAERVVVPEDLPRGWRGGDARWIEDDGLDRRSLASVDGALTGCACAVAETGTVVLDGGPYQGRRAITLLPDYHACVVQT